MASGVDEIGVETARADGGASRLWPWSRLRPGQEERRRLQSPPQLRFVRGPDGTALGIWLLTRLTIFGFAWNLAWVTQPLTKYEPRGFGGLWQRWDWVRYSDIAAHGYSLRARHGASIAFFPGYPLALRAVHLVLRSWIYTGLIISFAAGAVAAVALARIIAAEAQARFGADDAGLGQVRTAVREGVLFWAFAPAAVFLAAGYTEALFLAFALPAWLAARRGRWLTAGLLLAGGSAIRVNGLFELAAVVVLFAQTRPRGLRAWLRGTPLLIALAPVVAFVVYLHSLTGSWLAWQHAEAAGWDRHVTEPLRTLVNTLRYAFGGKILPAYNAWEYQLELLAMAVGVALLVWLLVRRRWAESVYVGLSVVSLGTSHVYLSVPREMLLWWPLWAALGVWTVRRPWIKTAYLAVATPLMFTVAYLFLMGLWAG